MKEKIAQAVRSVSAKAMAAAVEVSYRAGLADSMLIIGVVLVLVGAWTRHQLKVKCDW